jgi:hypothetical protein
MHRGVQRRASPDRVGRFSRCRGSHADRLGVHIAVSCRKVTIAPDPGADKLDAEMTDLARPALAKLK